jgi:hypothetical protein
LLQQTQTTTIWSSQQNIRFKDLQHGAGRGIVVIFRHQPIISFCWGELWKPLKEWVLEHFHKETSSNFSQAPDLRVCTVSSWCNDRAVAHIEQVDVGSMVTLHIWQEMPANPSSLRGRVGMRQAWGQPIRRRRPRLY